MSPFYAEINNMNDQTSLPELFTRFNALTNLSLRKSAAVLGVSHATVDRWARGAAPEVETTQVAEARRRMQEVIDYNNATDLFDELRSMPGQYRYDKIKQFIESSIR